MKIFKGFLLSSLILITSCSVSVHTNKKMNEDKIIEAIGIAIQDFIYREDYEDLADVFEIRILDTSKYIKFSIIPADDEIHLTKSIKPGVYSKSFPTRYIEVLGTLFFWNDSSKVITEDILHILNKYKWIDSTYVNYDVYIGGTINESPKGCIYTVSPYTMRIIKVIEL